jgi:magnesium transporter
MIDSIQNEKNRWIHISAPTESDIRYLADNYRFHPLDLEDIRSQVERPRIDHYTNYYFMVIHYPYLLPDNRTIKTAELDLFWGRDFLITISHTKTNLIPNFFYSIKENRAKTSEYLNNTITWILYQLINHIFVNSSRIIKINARLIDEINIDLFNNKKANKTIEKISLVRTNSIILNTIFKPQLAIFSRLESGQFKGFDEQMEAYWSDAADSIRRLWDIIEDHQELIESLSNTFDSLTSNRTNEVMKVLTFFSAILLPLSVVSGIYGMNVDLPLQDNPMAFIFISGFMGIIIFSMFVFFKFKNWI